MKKKLLVSLCLLAISNIVSSQNLLWSKKIEQSTVCVSKGLMTDKNGIVYSYGSRSLDNNQNPATPPLNDTSGSFLQSYSTNGALLFSKRWVIPFYIEKMEYDGNLNIYFSGTFIGTQIIDGITIVSEGNLDGVTGKMDLTGHILWMKTFGGSGGDRGNGICFNSADNSVYATGDIRDTLSLNNSFVSINQQSAIIVHYSSTGTFINHKLYDFVSNRNLGNINSGREICKDQSGNFFLLMDRDGQTPLSIASTQDTVTGPIMGRYVIKLNSNLDTVWSTYIIGPAAYYGWDCKDLRAAANGDVYIAWEGNGKYGGDAYLSRLNGSTGQINWNYHNQDGSYADLFIDVNTVYLIGNEGANGCPCQDNNAGYYVLKKFDSNNALLGETRFSNVYLNSITKDVSGNLFVTGNFSEKTVIIGKDTLSGDIDTLFSPGLPRYYGRFLTKLSDINCIAPIISVSVPISSSGGQSYPLCSGNAATLTVNLTQGTFVWSNGVTGTHTDVTVTGFYSVINTQASGCIAYSLPVDIEVNGVTPGAIFGNTTICSGTINTYSITPVNGASDYTWTLPPGWTGTSTSNKINATASTTSGNISVTENNICGTSAARTFSVTVGATSIATPGSISGNTTVCSGSSNTYSITAVSDASSYIWTIPSGWTGSSTTNLINTTASTTSGIITVKGTSSCGTSASRTFNVNINAASSGTPRVISGDATVCFGSSNTYSINAINSSSSFIWTLPSGWSGSSTSTSINTTAGATSGNISVTENGLCGVYTPKTITVQAIDNTVTQTGDTLTANMNNATYQWIDCSNNATITNATNQDFIPSASGTYAVIITKNSCMDTSACNNFVMTGIVNVSVATEFSVFPNPTDNFININYKSNELNGGFSLEIKNILGQTVYASAISSFQGEYKNAIDLSKEHSGIYFVQIIAGGKTIVKKIILN